MRDRDSLKSVAERDADLVFIQLVQSSAGFRNWLLQQLGVNEDFVFDDVWHSVVQESGESDIEISFRNEDSDLLVLVEDKIDAEKQPRQAERYVERGEKYLQDGWDQYEVCLVAPEEYVSDQDEEEFKNIIYYEDILDFVQNRMELDNQEFIEELLRKAIDKGEKGWEKTKDEKMTDFKQFYWRLASEKAPELEIEKPEKIPSNSVWMEMTPSVLEGGDQIIHKMKQGVIDLQLDADSHDLDKVEESLSDTEFWASVSDSGSTIFVRANLKQIEDFSNPDQHQETILEALEKASRLRQIYIQELR